MLNCREVTNRANDLIDGDLDVITRLKMRAHLLACRECARFVRQMRATVDLLEAGREQESPAIQEDLMTAFRERRQSDPDQP